MLWRIIEIKGTESSMNTWLARLLVEDGHRCIVWTSMFHGKVVIVICIDYIGLNVRKRCVSINMQHDVHRHCAPSSTAILGIGVSFLGLATKRCWTILIAWANHANDSLKWTISFATEWSKIDSLCIILKVCLFHQQASCSPIRIDNSHASSSDVCSPLARITFLSSHWICTKWLSLLFVSERISVTSVSHALSSARWSIVALAIHYQSTVHRSRRNQTQYDLSSWTRCRTHLWPTIPSFLVSGSRSSSNVKCSSTRYD